MHLVGDVQRSEERRIKGADRPAVPLHFRDLRGHEVRELREVGIVVFALQLVLFAEENDFV